MKFKFLLSITITHLFALSLLGAPQLLYSTYFGGSGNDGDSNWLNHFTIDDNGNIYFAFHTYSRNIPVTDNAYDKSYNGGHATWGGEDLAIVHYNLEQNHPVYCSYFGGSNGPDFVSQVFQIDDKLYLSGNTGSGNFPVTPSAYDATFNGPVFRHADGYIACFAQDTLYYSTYLGSSGNEWVAAICPNPAGEIIVAGCMEKPAERNFTRQFAAEGFEDSSNVVVYRFSPALDSLLTSTAIGPAGIDDMVLDDEGYIYLTGCTNYAEFPVTNGAFDTSFNDTVVPGVGDVYITKLSPNGDTLIFSSFLGGSAREMYPRIALDSGNNIFIYGRTHSTDFPVSATAPDTSFSGESELFLTKISNDGSKLLYSTFWGGNQDNNEFLGNVVVSDAGDIYICGTTDAQDFHTTPDAISRTHAGDADVFISVFDSAFKVKYSTFLGGSANDRDPVLEVDTYGNIIGVCSTLSTDFPVTSGAYDTSQNGLRDMIIFKIGESTTSGLNDLNVPNHMQIYQNHPSPFNQSTVISYRLAAYSQVHININSTLGLHMANLYSGQQSPGNHQITWHGTNDEGSMVESGFDFCRLQTSDIIQAKKMLFIN